MKNNQKGSIQVLLIIFVVVLLFVFTFWYFFLGAPGPEDTVSNNTQPVPSTLTWSPDQGELIWDNAKKTCSNLSVAGTWRLPTKDELLVGLNNQFTKHLPISGNDFTSAKMYWSVGGYNNNSNDAGAWAVGGASNGVFNDYYAKQRQFMVRCVK